MILNPIPRRKKLKKKKSSKSDNLILAICIIGMILHTGYLISVYLRYEMVSEIEISLPDKFITPYFSLCLSQSPFFNPKNTTMKAMMDKPPYFRSRGKYYWKSGYLCNRYQGGKFINQQKSGIRDLLGGYILLHNLENLSFRIEIAVHRSKFLYNLEDNMLYVNYDESNQFSHLTLTYDKIVTQHLESPYGQGCYNYISNNIPSRGECYQKCLLSICKNYLIKATYLPGEYLEEYPARFYDASDSVKIKCRNLCPRECYDEKYYTILITQKMSRTNSVLIALFYRIRPETDIKISPMFTLTGLIIYLASILGMWLGGNFFGTILISKQFISRYLKL